MTISTAAKDARNRLLLAVGLLVAMAPLGPAVFAAEFFGLGHLPGTDRSHARDVSADGSVIVGWSRPQTLGDDPVAFRWTRDNGMESIGFLPGDNRSRAYGVSADGSVIVGHSSEFIPDVDGVPQPWFQQAFRWTPETGLVGLGGGTARDVSDDGAVVSGWDAGRYPEAFRWTEETGMTGLEFLSDDALSQASGVSADESVIVGLSRPRQHGSPSEPSEAFRWTEATGMLPLAPPTSPRSSDL